MTRFSVFIATTLDGFIARGDGRIDFLSVAEREAEDCSEAFESGLVQLEYVPRF